MPLTDRAENVLLQLKLEGIGTRPLVFMTHSMGGLLVKQLLRTASDSPDPKWRAVLEQTRGVCFIATPHIGSDLAKWGTYFRTLLGTNVSMDELRPHEPLLRNLKQWYSNFVSRGRVGDQDAVVLRDEAAARPRRRWSSRATPTQAFR